MKKRTLVGIILLLVTDITVSIRLANVVPAPSPTITKLIKDGTDAFDIQWALASNVTQMSSNLSALAFANVNMSSTAHWLPINSTMAVSVLQSGSFLSSNETQLLLTRTDTQPFEIVTAVKVNMSTEYFIMVLERAFNSANSTTVYALISTKFLSPATLVAEISIINGSLLRQFDASAVSSRLGLSDLWDISSSDNILVMINGLGLLSLHRDSLKLSRIYRPSDGIFPVDLVGGAALIDVNTLIWSNVTRETNLTELRMWDFVSQEISSSILLSNETFEDLQLESSFIGVDRKTGNIWTTFLSFGPGEYLGTSVIYHYIRESQIIHQEIRLGEWLGWVEAAHSQVGALIIDDSLCVVTLNTSNAVVIQKFIDDHFILAIDTHSFYTEQKESSVRLH